MCVCYPATHTFLFAEKSKQCVFPKPCHRFDCFFILQSDFLCATSFLLKASFHLCVCRSCFSCLSHLTTTFQVAVNQLNVRRDKKITQPKVKETSWKGKVEIRLSKNFISTFSQSHMTTTFQVAVK